MMETLAAIAVFVLIIVAVIWAGSGPPTDDGNSNWSGPTSGGTG